MCSKANHACLAKHIKKVLKLDEFRNLRLVYFILAIAICRCIGLSISKRKRELIAIYSIWFYLVFKEGFVSWPSFLPTGGNNHILKTCLKRISLISLQGHCPVSSPAETCLLYSYISCAFDAYTIKKTTTGLIICNHACCLALKFSSI